MAMPTNMPTVTETLEALKVVRRFVEGMHDVFSPGRAASPSMRSFPRVIVQDVPEDQPDTWKARVFTILMDAGRPMQPSEITAEYRKRGWVLPPNTKLGNLIRSTLALAKRQKAIIHDGEGRYRLAKQKR